MTTLTEALRTVVVRLRDAGVPSPEVDARWLVEAVTGCDPRRDAQAPLAGDDERELARLVDRRCAREPLQLVIGTTAFHDIELRCRPGVFIPRPETEVLAGIALDLVRGRGSAIVLEPCCGTGAIGLTIASGTDRAVVTIADRSEAAVVLAEENRERLESAGRLRSPVVVRRGPLMDPFDPALRGHVDVLVANPPYLPLADLPSMEPEVAAHDPHDALFGGPDGHEVVDALLSAASDWLAPGGTVVLEIDARRSASALVRAREEGLVDVEARQDLTGADRFVLARRPGPDPLRR